MEGGERLTPGESSSVIDDLTNTEGELQAYIYCDFQTGRSTSAVEVTCSLLAQLMACLCVARINPEDFLDALLKDTDSRVDPFYSVRLSVKGRKVMSSKASGRCRRTRRVQRGGDPPRRHHITSRPLQNIIQTHPHLPCISMGKMVRELSADILLHAVPGGLLTRVLRVQPHQFTLFIIHRLVQTAEFVEWAVAPWGNERLLETFVEDEEYYEQIKGGDELMLATRAFSQASCAEVLFLVAVETGCIAVIRTLLSMNTSFPLVGLQYECKRLIVGMQSSRCGCPCGQWGYSSPCSYEADCSPRERDADNKPPIHTAVARGFVSVVEYPLSLDVPLPSRILFSALLSTLVKRVEMIRFLVSKGANVIVLNPDGDNLLHTNIRSLDRSVSSCLEIATEMLIDIGCDPLVRNLRGEFPLQIAAKQRHLLSFSSPMCMSPLAENPRRKYR
ncbi:hypothetical protein J3R82DRAFT_4814 [Butyriboletus roseoflavus]|nr:hypothetical protein J3R82DRAFT_4814 [Butyriboletus roseoflavus]